MRLLLLLNLLLLTPPPAQAAGDVELLCEPNAKVLFLSRWVRGSVVRLEAGVTWELPWGFRDTITTGSALRNERVREFDTTEEAAQDELLNVVPLETRFLTFRPSHQGQSPITHTLYVDKDLLTSREHDGLVIAQQSVENEISHSRAAKTVVAVYHCRSR